MKRLGGIIVSSMLFMAAHSSVSALETPIPIRNLRVKFSGSPPDGKSLKMLSYGQFPLPAGNPAGMGGKLLIAIGKGTLACALSAQPYDGIHGWTILGNPENPAGYKYRNRNAGGSPAEDPCSSVILNSSTIKIIAKGTDNLPVPVDGPPEGLGNPPAVVSLSLGPDRFCAYANAPHEREVADRIILARKQIAPEECPRFIDNGNGTVTDFKTGLVWEKKDDNNSGGTHDKDNIYSWAGCCGGACESESDLCQPNEASSVLCLLETNGAVGCAECTSEICEVNPNSTGALTTIWDWLVQLNQSGFAGQSDWRIPEMDFEGIEELNTLIQMYRDHPPYIFNEFDNACSAGCILPNECSCTGEAEYWSSTSFRYVPETAWFANFNGGSVFLDLKQNALHARAVRGGF